ncbi:hypothetical protein SAMN06265360_101247 [Haloechinothrix alba]|uniref:DUF6292 domain-containing protein n=1 Tax=Haloechinothrix alba TaxID=664784 RepID=A0A238V3S8_9PSEU|nr:DUF6292 family protein [Haloechinothrix alba]SNR28677.1 hypothetical protein SAMN06265360_101247 [Haloechinothrix alba]
MDADTTDDLSRGLAAYVHAVAKALDVPVEGTTCEVSDTATAYLALATRLANYPDHDLMLVWSEQHGWEAAVETEPGVVTEVIAYFGDEPLPEPGQVLAFVRAIVEGRHWGGSRPTFSTVDNRRELAARSSRYITGRDSDT